MDNLYLQDPNSFAVETVHTYRGVEALFISSFGLA